VPAGVPRWISYPLAVLNRDVSQADNLTLLEERDGRVVLVSQIELLLPAESRGAANAHDVIALDERTLLVARYQRPSLEAGDLPLQLLVGHPP
jgi:hypothetical protein